MQGQQRYLQTLGNIMRHLFTQNHIKPNMYWAVTNLRGYIAGGDVGGFNSGPGGGGGTSLRPGQYLAPHPPPAAAQQPPQAPPQLRQQPAPPPHNATPAPASHSQHHTHSHAPHPQHTQHHQVLQVSPHTLMLPFEKTSNLCICCLVILLLYWLIILFTPFYIILPILFASEHQIWIGSLINLIQLMDPLKPHYERKYQNVSVNQIILLQAILYSML